MKIMDKPAVSRYGKSLDSCDVSVMTAYKVKDMFYNQGIWHENNVPAQLNNWRPEEHKKYKVWWHHTNPADPSDPGEDKLDYIEEWKDPDGPVYMVAYSKESEADWYGEFNYYGNSLDKYLPTSKMWESKIKRGSSRGTGHEAVAVKTTISNLKLLGWETDYDKYAISQDTYDNFK